MTTQSPLSIADQRQRVILRIGSVYDGGFGVPLLCMPALIMNSLSLPLPDVGLIWLRLDGIFLIVLGVIYWIMSGNPSRYLAMIGVILAGKVGSIVFYVAAVFAFQQSKTFLLFAALDAVMFSLHMWALGPGGLGRIRDAMQPAPAHVA